MRTSLAVALVVLTTCACGGPEPVDRAGEPLPRSQSGQPTDDEDAPDLSLSFDGDDRGVPVSANGGVVEVVPGAPGRGLAVAFPARCTAPTGCPRALVEVAPEPSLVPGTRPFAYGATVWLAASQATSGSNIVQQGRFGSEDGQWKLQVDDAAGRPSCVIRSATGEATVRSDVSVADGAWHQVTCRRDAEGVSVEVDGTVDRVVAEVGRVGGSAPIRIGSPGTGDQDDQFHGRVDDVFLEIGSDG